jgi:hypothetical protein
MSPEHVKVAAEAIGVCMTVTAIALSLWVRRAGPWISLLGFIPWTVFAVCTHSWLLIGQNVVVSAINIWSLLFSPVYRRPRPLGKLLRWAALRGRSPSSKS